MQIVCNELDSKRCDPDISTYSFLSILFCIYPIPFYFIKSLYIFYTSSLLLFFVLFPVSFRSSVLKSALFFISSLFLLSAFFFSLPRLFLSSCLIIYLCLSIFFFRCCTFMSLPFLFFLSLSSFTFFFRYVTILLQLLSYCDTV